MKNQTTVNMWRNPVLRSQNETVAGIHPSGQVNEKDLMALFGAGDVKEEGLSSWLGNNGKYCTLTVECMPTC